jgi:hypothetical protein
MPKRPTSVTVIGWILIVLGALGVLGMSFSLANSAARQAMALNPMPIPVQFALAFAGLGVSIVSGAFILRGANWARWLYLGWSVFGFAVSLATSPSKLMLLPSLLVFAIIALFLLLPKANAYFVPAPGAAPDAGA